MHTQIGETLVRLGLQPHPTPAAATAERIDAGVRHLDQIEAGDSAQHRARRLDLVIVPRQVAGIVKRDGEIDRLRKREPFIGQKLGQILGVVQRLELVGIVLAEGVVAVRGERHELRDAALAEDLRGVRDDLLEIGLMSDVEHLRAAGRFGIAQHAERHAGRAEHAHQRRRHLLRARIVGGRAADVEQDLVRVGIKGRERQILRPRRPLRGRLLPGIVVPVDRPEQRGQALRRGVALPIDVPQRAEDLGDGHAARAIGLALRAGGAEPQRIAQLQAKLHPPDQVAHGNRLLAHQAPGTRGRAGSALITHRCGALGQFDQLLPHLVIQGNDALVHRR